MKRKIAQFTFSSLCDRIGNKKEGDSMNDNIMNILDETVNGRLEINKKALEKLIVTTCSQNELEGYVRGIYFTTQEEILNAPMCYHSVGKMIGINTNRVKEYLNTIMTLTLDNHLIEESHQDMYLKTNLGHIVLHEIEHAHQDKVSKEKKKDIESRLVSLNFHMDFLRRQPIIFKEELNRNEREAITLKNKYRSTSPAERLAEYHSVKEVLSYLSNVTTDYSDIASIFSGCLINELLRGYDFSMDISSPMERYIDDFKKAKFLRGNRYFTKAFYQSLDEAKKDTLEKRLSLGLDITEEEYIKVKKRVV